MEAAKFADIPIVPTPYGKMLPDLRGAYYPPIGSIICPACGSNHVCAPNTALNLTLIAENISPASRWFCITCQESWCYERER